MLDQPKFTQLRLLTQKKQPFLTLRSLQLVSRMTHSVELKTGHYSRVRKIQTLEFFYCKLTFIHGFSVFTDFTQTFTPPHQNLT